MYFETAQDWWIFNGGQTVLVFDKQISPQKMVSRMTFTRFPSLNCKVWMYMIVPDGVDVEHEVVKWIRI